MLSLSSPHTPDVARVLADGRKRRGLSLQQLAIRAGTSKSHLSRIENGERGGVSRELLGRLADVLEIDAGELFAAAHQLPPDVERELADPELARALVERYQLPAPTRAALRRLHLAQMVDERFPLVPRRLHDPIELLGDRGYRFGVTRGPNGVTIDGTVVNATIEGLAADAGEAEVRSTARFLAAHALGHVVLEPEPACAFRTLVPAEREATAFASYLLAPAPILRTVVLALSREADVWRGATGALIENVAARLVAPSWLVARRAAEDGLLAEVAKVGDL
ncbi:MAG TPA: helix-turn-helix domain-containing protein [Vicinamibacterales bacterium]|nr:helix-turn-helix domain-containing protein [Vicinamibacterales bacterium]